MFYSYSFFNKKKHNQLYIIDDMLKILKLKIKDLKTSELIKYNIMKTFYSKYLNQSAINNCLAKIFI